MEEVCCLEYTDVPTYILQGKKKPKKIYLTYNVIYAGVHHSVRTSIKDTIKTFLGSKLRDIPLFKSPIKVQFEYISKRKQFDLDNKCSLFNKVFMDMIKGVKIKDDNVQWVDGVEYKYRYTDNNTDSLIIRIFQ